jgi:hypothetical protein
MALFDDILAPGDVDNKCLPGESSGGAGPYRPWTTAGGITPESAGSLDGSNRRRSAWTKTSHASQERCLEGLGPRAPVPVAKRTGLRPENGCADLPAPLHMAMRRASGSARRGTSMSFPLALRLPMPMYDSENHDLVRQDAEEHAIRKPPDNRTACGVMNYGKRLWPFQDRRNGQIQLERELLAKSGALLFVPMPRFEELGFRLRPKDQPTRHGRFRSFRRTSSQGSALPGSARCCSSRRSNSAACARVSANSAPR